MATSKKLNNITVSQAPGQVGISLNYIDAPAEHLLISIETATKVRDRLTEAIALAGAAPKHPGDGVSISDASTVRIFNPKEH